MNRTALILLTLTLLAFPVQGQSDKVAEDPAATKLLKDAIATRATWDGFPGFTANLTINHNGKITKGKVTVHDSGKVDLEIADEAMKKWTRNQLLSLVGHRMGGAPAKDTPCAFGDKHADHPLGQKILVLGDKMHSSYRIKDNQITEVNRQMEESHFTIIVLKNYVTPEKKYLPAYYVVNFWKNGTNQLQTSASHYHTWKRVGKFDLPETLTIFTAKSGGGDISTPIGSGGELIRDSWTITFNNLDLLPWKSK